MVLCVITAKVLATLVLQIAADLDLTSGRSYQVIDSGAYLLIDSLLRLWLGSGRREVELSSFCHLTNQELAVPHRFDNFFRM